MYASDLGHTGSFSGSMVSRKSSSSPSDRLSGMIQTPTRGNRLVASMIVPFSSGCFGTSTPSASSLPLTASHRPSHESLASTTMPSALRPDTRSSGRIAARTFSTLPRSSAQNSGRLSIALRRCMATAWSSPPSTNSKHGSSLCSLGRFMDLPDLNTLVSYNPQLILQVLHCPHFAIPLFDADERTFDGIQLIGRLCEPSRTIPAVCCRKHLDIVLMCRLHDHAPEVALDGMVNAVLGFVDQQKALHAVRQTKSYTQQPHRAIAQTLERYRAPFASKFHHRRSDISSETVLPIDDRDSLHTVSKCQVQGPYRAILLVG